MGIVIVIEKADKALMMKAEEELEGIKVPTKIT